ncbi:MAG: hypothetical protein ACRCWR_07095 [Saezia sp.]
MGVNKLDIKLFEFCYPGKNHSGMQFYRRADFLVDGEAFSHFFDELKEVPHLVSTQLDKNPPPEAVIEQFYGVASDEASNSGRFVLYRVKGPDGGAQGFVSCVIERNGNQIFWKGIRCEGLGADFSCPDLTFDFEEYQTELEDYIERNPVTKA